MFYICGINWGHLMLLLRNSWDPYHERPGLNVCRDWIILSVLEVRIKCQWGQIQISPVALCYRCPLQGRMLCVVLLDRVLCRLWNWSECRCRTGVPTELLGYFSKRRRTFLHKVNVRNPFSQYYRERTMCFILLCIFRYSKLLSQSLPT